MRSAFAAVAVAVALISLAASTAALAGTTRALDIAYEPDPLGERRLDLFLPERRSGVPLVVFVHGGGFQEGDRKDYAFVGETLARQGVAAAVVSYRLFPEADAKAAIDDVAHAVAWTMLHAGDYGLDPRNVFLAGHSSGALIAAALLTNQDFLANVGFHPHDLRGAILLSGQYDVRDLSDEDARDQALDRHVYGDTVERRAAVSAMAHVAGTTVPMEVFCGGRESPRSCAHADAFVRALLAANDAAVLIEEDMADHLGMVTNAARPGDGINEEIVNFVRGRGQIRLIPLPAPSH